MSSNTECQLCRHGPSPVVRHQPPGVYVRVTWLSEQHAGGLEEGSPEEYEPEQEERRRRRWTGAGGAAPSRALRKNDGL